MRAWWIFTLIFVSAFAWAEPGQAPRELAGVGVKEHLGETVRIGDLHFSDEAGRDVVLSDYFKTGHPVLLALVYYECPNLCNLLLNGLFESLKKLDWSAGHQYEIVAVSINPHETAELAAHKKANYARIYGIPEVGIHFLTSPREDQVQALASQVGFQYRYDPAQKQYLHAAVVSVLTPEGRISRYLYGISFQSKELRLSLLEASSGKVGTVVDRVLLFCFHFDPAKKSYTFRIWRVVQIVLSIQVVLLVAGIGYLRWSERKT